MTARKGVHIDPAPHREFEARLGLLAVAEAALSSVMPDGALFRAVARDGQTLGLGTRRLVLSDYERVVVLGLGKAAVPMAQATLRLLAPLRPEGVLVTPTVSPVDGLEVVAGAHPVPDEGSVRGGKRILDAAATVRPSDLVFVLISGGGSAVATVPAKTITLDDLRTTNRLLLRSGATINELNAVRKHLSALKGGRLAEALASAGAVVTLIISDVIGSPLDVIASGPTVPDPSTYRDAMDVLIRYDLMDKVPRSVRKRIEDGDRGLVPDTPKDNSAFGQQTIEVLASGETAAAAAKDAVERSGDTAEIVRTDLEGEAREVAVDLVRAADDLEPGHTRIYAGETTVTVKGDGRGGRNQELALAAAIALAGRDDLTILSLGTDGIDGMSPSAGAFGDGHAVARGQALGLDAADYLERNDSHRFLSATGYTVDSGPTGTNVGDLILVKKRRR